MARRRRSRPAPDRRSVDSAPRIIGGKFRGTRLAYSGDSRTRPMKDRVREAAFNLIGPIPAGTLAVDLFAGTGALALEALSRGAENALMLERHFPTAKLIRQNIEQLQLGERCEVLACDAFHWAETGLESLGRGAPWLVFYSPPYLFYDERREDMLGLIERFQAASPSGSLLVAEFDNQSFDAKLLPQADTWDARSYSPAMIAVWKAEGQPPQASAEDVI